MKRMLSLLLTLALLLTCVPAAPVTVRAETVTEDQIPVTQTITVEADLPSNDELFAAYVENVFYGSGDVSTFGIAAGQRLTGDDKVLYDALVTVIKQIAAGERSSTVIGVGQEIAGNVPDVEAYFTGSDFPDLNKVFDALLSDLPYELYWFDKTIGCSAWGYPGTYIELSFFVAENYGTGQQFQVDTGKTGAAAAAANNAKEIVMNYAGASDYEKLVGYKTAICNLVDYNDDAAAGGYFSQNDDPWQLIYVFDGNPATKVVCEGYSKAFMYLCDLTTFKGDVTCYTVSGVMYANGGGGHMWNIVTLEGNNYLVDVTNSDDGSIGQNGQLFLAGAAGSAATGYTISTTYIPIQYIYYSDALELWGSGADSILTLSAENYTPGADEEEQPATSGTCGDNLTWVLDEDGTLTISGTGDMYEYAVGDTPWNAYSEEIRTVVAENGVTGIAPYAFCRFTNLTSVSMAASVTRIGESAFAECSGLTSITLPSGLNSIEDDVFNCCTGLTGITIPDNVTAIGDRAFYNCTGLSDIVIPEKVTRIGTDAFGWCEGLTSVSLSDSVTDIADSAFYYCGSLPSITIPSGVTSIGDFAFTGCWALMSIVFEGNAPAIAEDALCDVTVTACYPGNNATWTEDVLQNYGGDITWVAQYEMLEGDGVIVHQGATPQLEIRADGEISKFESVSVDGEVVDPANYTVTEGSTIVTFAPAYLQTLTEGDHTVEVNFVDGSATASFTVEKASFLLGDVTGDGKVTATDYSRLLAHVKKVNLITDEAALAAADVTGDGKITATDYSRLLAHVKKVAPLW